MSEVRKSRVAVGVFDAVASLEHAIAELRAAGLEAHGFLLMTDDADFAGRFARTGSRTRRRRSSPRVVIHCDWAPPDLPASKVRDGGPGRRAAPPSLSPERLVRFEDWIAARLSEELRGRLAQGACILFAPIAGASQEQMISQILLHHAIGPVQLHDLRLPGPLAGR